jgi:hypothetical protein
MFTKDEERCMNAIVEFDVTGDILTRLESQQTPVRIQGQRQAYYILSVDQLLTLLQPPMHFEDDTSFAPEDFGLTEDDVTAYLARRHERQQKLGTTPSMQLPVDLQQRLDWLRAISSVSINASPDEQTMQALEAAMLHSLATTIQTMKQ